MHPLRLCQVWLRSALRDNLWVLVRHTVIATCTFCIPCLTINLSDASVSGLPSELQFYLCGPSVLSEDYANQAVRVLLKPTRTSSFSEILSIRWGTVHTGFSERLCFTHVLLSTRFSFPLATSSAKRPQRVKLTVENLRTDFLVPTKATCEFFTVSFTASIRVRARKYVDEPTCAL